MPQIGSHVTPARSNPDNKSTHHNTHHIPTMTPSNAAGFRSITNSHQKKLLKLLARLHSAAWAAPVTDPDAATLANRLDEILRTLPEAVERDITTSS